MINITSHLKNIVLLFILAATLTAPQAVATVTIPDPGLDSAIRTNLGLGPTDPITESALAGITVLGAINKGIVDLTGLEYCTSLSVLVLPVNQISDLTPLQGLISLETLELTTNQISDLTPLQGLTAVAELYLAGNKISDLTPLQGFWRLGWVHLEENQISDLTPLQGLTKIADLYLGSNCISDLSPLLGLPYLNDLDVDYNPLSDTAITVQIPQLESNPATIIFNTWSDENCPVAEGEGEGQSEGEGEEEGEGEGIENPEGCPKPYGGTYEAGDDLCLCVPLPVSSTSTYAWAKDGVSLTDVGRIYGANARTLHIIPLTIEDSGLYTCTYEDGSKAIQVFEAPVLVVEELPALNTIGLIALAAAGSMLGFLIRKKRA